MYEILTISSAMISWQWDYKGLFKSCEDCLAVADDGDTLKEQGEVVEMQKAVNFMNQSPICCQKCVCTLILGVLRKF